MRPGTHRLSLLSATAFILLAEQAGAQTKPADPGLLSLDRVFASRDLAAERFGPARWILGSIRAVSARLPVASSRNPRWTRPLRGRR